MYLIFFYDFTASYQDPDGAQETIRIEGSGKWTFYGRYVLNVFVPTYINNPQIMENYQNEDATITIPKVLRNYMGGKTVI